MIRILVTGDTHAPRRVLPEWLLGLAARADLVLHTGDVCDLATLGILSSLAPVLAVGGNNDGELRLPERMVLRIEGLEVGVTHGHLGSGDTTRARALALLPTVDVALFGHSHQAGIWREGKRLVVNPGSPTRPVGAPASAAWLDLVGGVAEARLVHGGP